VAVLYCFLNAEVRSEMSKKWAKSSWNQRKEKAHPGRNSSRGWLPRWSRSSYVTSNMSIECRKVNEPNNRPTTCVPLCEETIREGVRKCHCEDVSLFSARHYRILFLSNMLHYILRSFPAPKSFNFDSKRMQNQCMCLYIDGFLPMKCFQICDCEEERAVIEI